MGRREDQMDEKEREWGSGEEKGERRKTKKRVTVHFLYTSLRV